MYPKSVMVFLSQDENCTRITASVCHTVQCKNLQIAVVLRWKFENYCLNFAKNCDENAASLSLSPPPQQLASTEQPRPDTAAEAGVPAVPDRP